MAIVVMRRRSPLQTSLLGLLLYCLLQEWSAALSLRPQPFLGIGFALSAARGEGEVLSPSPPPLTDNNRHALANETESSSITTIPFLDFNLTESRTTLRQYNWREFLPRNASFAKWAQWFVTGTLPSIQTTDAKLQRDLASLARTLLLLRAYEAQYGIPTTMGGSEIQRQVLADVIRDLYGSGAPIWVLENVMERVAEGMTGKTGVQYLLLPNRCFIFYPTLFSSSAALPSSSAAASNTRGTTDMFKIAPGFFIAKLGAVEQVAVRLASFASNTRSVERLGAAAFRTPQRDELAVIQQRETRHVAKDLAERQPTADELGREILNLASSTYGLFFFLNNPKFQAGIRNATGDDSSLDASLDAVYNFWTVSNTTRELFTRLAAQEAADSMEQVRRNERVLYSPWAVCFFRSMSAAGACAMWFGGSWSDMVASGVMSLMVAYIGSFQIAALEGRILTEVVASFVVGLCSGVLALQFPERFSFGSMAVASVMDILQGFKVVYAVIEVMSKHVVAGAGRLLEGILFTGLISYSLKGGLDLAFRLMLGPGGAATRDYSSMLISLHGIPHALFPILLPFTALAWSGLFRPSYADLSLMAWHGILAFGLTWAGAPLFASAMAVTFSAGIFSRFTGREALGNTLSGLYALVPGTVSGVISFALSTRLLRSDDSLFAVLYWATTIFFSSCSTWYGPCYHPAVPTLWKRS